MKDVCLVTGGLGFLGSWLAKQLIYQGKEVIILDDLSGGFMENMPDGANLYVGSISNKHLVENIFRHHSPRFVFHLAAYAAENLSPFIRTYNCRNNIEGSEVLITAAINHGVECFVFASSIAVYGNQTPPFGEDDPIRPMDPYGAAKAYVESSLLNASNLHGLNSVVFRPFNIYGPNQNIGDPYRNVLGIFMNQCLKGEPMTIFGDGLQTRAFTYVEDIIPIMASVCERPSCWNETFNIGSDFPETVETIATDIAQAMGVERNVRHLHDRHEAKHAYCKTYKMQQYFEDIYHRTPLAEGIEQMAKWAKAHGARTTKPFAKIEITRKLPPHWLSL
jgi:UDP-glucose 4-epimerase